MNKYPGILVPPKVNHIIDVLQSNGYQAYVVGGCIRDCILGVEPGDWDIATDALPLALKQLFPRTVDTGIKHGTVTVLADGTGYEVTTYRVDGEYIDFRKPENVTFTKSITEDLSRRDFTINAMAYNPDRGLVDPFGGIQDIEARTIRTVGDPDKRFKEDALRMLRAVRFSAQLGFSVSEGTKASISKNHQLIANISAERIREELTKTLLSDNPLCFSLLMETKLIRYTLPEFEPCFSTVQNNPYHSYDVATHTLLSVSNIKKDKVLRWTMLLHDIGKPGTRTTDEKGIDHFYNHQMLSVKLSAEAMKRLRFDNRSTDRILQLIKHHDLHIKLEHKAVRKAISKVGEDVFPELLQVMEADKKAQNPSLMAERTVRFAKLWEIYNDIREKGQCTSLKSLAVNGDDLIALGMKPGREMKQQLGSLLERVIDQPELNNREALLNLLKHKLNKNKK